MVMGWLSNNLAPHYVRATGIGFLVAVANCAAFVATFTYLTKDSYVLNHIREWDLLIQPSPDYVLGHSINIGALVLCIVVVSCGILYCKFENKKRAEGARNSRLTESKLLGHRHPNFRYTI